MYDNLERAAFDNFDDSMDSFDPSMSDNFQPKRGMQRIGQKPAASVIRKSPTQTQSFGRAIPQASFTINIDNQGSVTQNVELFNALFSISKIKNASLYGLTQPLLSTPASSIQVDSSSPTPAGSKSLFGYLRNVDIANGGLSETCSFNENGDMVFTNPAADKTTIACTTVPYRALLEATMNGSFRIDTIRATFSSSNQIAQSIIHRDRTILGGTRENNINPNDYFRPDQFQSLRVDIPVGLSIDRQKGLFFPVLAGETINMTVFVSQYSFNLI
jgi:hypothetical protein